MTPRDLKFLIVLAKDAQLRVQGGLLDMHKEDGTKIYAKASELEALLKSLDIAYAKEIQDLEFLRLKRTTSKKTKPQ
jgi:hypothetical protein